MKCGIQGPPVLLVMPNGPTKLTATVTQGVHCPDHMSPDSLQRPITLLNPPERAGYLTFLMGCFKCLRRKDIMDASAGMGFGTALTPLLLVIGFDPKQIVPVVMIQQGAAGLVGAFLHREFENVEWKFSPMSETVKLWLIIAGTGVLFNVTAIVGVYKIFHIAKIWIKLYVAVLLLLMGAVSLFQARKERPYKPKRMVVWAALAGFNKGVGGGGYGPVVTIGGLLAGVPVKSMLAVTAISEGTVSTIAVLAWISMLGSGVTIDYILLPSFMLATMFSAVAAPYMTRVFPEKAWKIVVPAYCLCLTVYAFYKIMPDLIQKLAGG